VSIRALKEMVITEASRALAIKRGDKSCIYPHRLKKSAFVFE